MDFGLEAIDFQQSSPLGDALTSLMRDIVEYRKTVTGSPQYIQKVVDYASTEISKHLPKIVHKHTGIEVTSVYFTESPSSCFAVLSNVGNDNNIRNIEEAYSGVKVLNAKTLQPTTVEELQKLTESINTRESKIHQEAMKKIHISCKIAFDVYSAFLAKDVLHKRLYYLTPRSIAAVLLHEIGHTMAMVEHAGDTYYRITSINKAFDHFKQNSTPTEQAKAVKWLAEKTTPTYMPNKQKDKLVAAAENAADLKENPKKKVPSRFIKDIVVSAGYLLVLLGEWTLALLSFIVGASAFIHDIALLKVMKLNDLKQKKSDFMVTAKNKFFVEKLADEFVVRHGFAADLTEALTTLHSYDDFLLGGAMRLMDNTTSKTVFIIAKSSGMAAAILGTQMAIKDRDSLVDRIKVLMQGTIQSFKENGLPPEVVDHYIEDYENTMDRLLEMGPYLKLNERMNRMWSLIHYYVSPVNLISMLSSGKITQEYQTLMNDIEKLESNTLWYRAAKLNQLSRQIK